MPKKIAKKELESEDEEHESEDETCEDDKSVEEDIELDCKNLTYLSFDIGTKNMACCVMDNNKYILQWELFAIKGATLEKQNLNLMTKLDELDLHTKYNNIIVLIERQPSFNPQMRVVEGSLLMYFVLKKSFNKKKGVDNFIKIITYSPKHKLKCYTPPKDNPIVLKCKPSGHYYRKQLAKEHCKRLLPELNEKWLTFFNKNKKKADDLADSFLQVMSYLKDN